MRPTSNFKHGSRARTGGFTLVELMVALTIGLVLALAISLSMLSMGRQFRVVGATSAAQVNAQLALSLIDSAGRTAGAGLFNNGLPVCASFNAWYAGTMVSNGAALLPARIIDGGNATTPDRLVFSASNAVGPLSAMPVLAPMVSADGVITVSDSGSLAVNDLAIVGVPGYASVPCKLFQVTGITTDTTGLTCGGNGNRCKTLSQTAGGDFNPPANTFATESRYGFVNSGFVSGPAAVMGLGAGFRQEAFAVICETLVQYNAFTDTPGCSTAPLNFNAGTNALVTDVVMMQAQYGISAASNSDVVTDWVDATAVNAWNNPTAANIGRIKALRVVIVSRSKEAATELVTAASCDNGNGVVNTGPCSFRDAQAPVIDLSATSVPAGRSWRNYRYRVQQAVVPLRNVIWSN